MEILSNEKAATLGLAEISLSVLSGLISPFDGFGDFGEVIIREGVVYSSRFSIVETNASRGKFVSILDYELFLNSFHVRDHFHYEGILELVKIFTWFSSELSRAVFSIKSGAKVYCVLIANEDPVLYFGLVRDSEWVEEWLAIYESETPALIAKTDFAVTAPMQGA